MAEVETSGPTIADVMSMIAANSALSFVGGGAQMTLADLMANFPASADTVGKYANISNLFNGVSMSAAGGLQEVVRCRYDANANAYRWTPQRPTDYSISLASTGGTINLTPLVTPPTVRFAGTLTGNLTILPVVTNAWVGLRWRTVQASVLGLFVTTVTNLIGSNLTLLGNTQKDIDYTSAGYFST
jgi:hypothetical protein